METYQMRTLKKFFFSFNLGEKFEVHESQGGISSGAVKAFKIYYRTFRRRSTDHGKILNDDLVKVPH